MRLDRVCIRLTKKYLIPLFIYPLIEKINISHNDHMRLDLNFE